MCECVLIMISKKKINFCYFVFIGLFLFLTDEINIFGLKPNKQKKPYPDQKKNCTEKYSLGTKIDKNRMFCQNQNIRLVAPHMQEQRKLIYRMFEEIFFFFVIIFGKFLLIIIIMVNYKSWRNEELKTMNRQR